MARLNGMKSSPEGFRAVYALEKYASSHVEREIYKLIELRSSQLNGCSYCVDMHGTEMHSDGVPFRKINSVAAWREAPWFSDRERAALALAEEVTLLPGGVPDDVWDAAEQAFGERELTDLLIGIATINVWNRILVSTRAVPDPPTLAE